MNVTPRFPAALGLSLLLGLHLARAASQQAVFNVRDYGATGDGSTLETEAINRAIDACHRAGGGQVLVPPGRYLTGTLRLQSQLTLHLESGARIIGTTNLTLYQQPSPPAYMPEARWGKWHRALLVGENLEDVTLSGSGIIDGNKVFDPTGEERQRGPHTLVFVNCRRFTVRDLTFLDSANYAVFFQASDQVDIRNVTFIGGWDGIHFRGAPGHDCQDVQITQCRFYTGDDAIAGRYWNNVLISDCVINSSCNGIRLIGPATRLTVHDCLFLGPGAQPHRSSGRTNMLAGILLQPGGWDATQGTLDDVLLSDITMHHVAAPVSVWLKPGNTAGRITVDRLSATGVYRAAFSAESWAESPITNLVLRNVTAEFDGGGTAEQAAATVRGPGVDPRPLPAWGIYLRNNERVTLENVRLTCARPDLRPVLLSESVRQLDLHGFRFTRVTGVDAPLTTNGVGVIDVRD